MTEQNKTNAQLPAKDQLFRGIGVSMGVSVGWVHLKPKDEHKIVEHEIAPEDIPKEIARFEAALIATRRQIRNLQKNSDPAVAGIFDAHLLILDDRPFIEKILEGVEKHKRNVEAVLADVSKNFAQALLKAADDYLRERAADVHDITRRIFLNLSGQAEASCAVTKENTVIVAHDMSPSDIVSIDKKLVIGIALDMGSPTSHAAILAGKLGIPAVVGLNSITSAVQTGDEILVDGSKGLVVVQPVQERVEHYNKIARAREKITVGLKRLKNLPAETKDGYRVMLSANIEQPQDIDAVISSGADGVGLFRTEYFFMSRSEIPTEEQQFEAYREVAERLSPASAIIRTLDLGGDKFLPSLDVAWDESNPFMGWRAIRFCLAQPDLFRTQLRAILRASVFGNVKIMYPMISNVDEILRANLILDNAKKELLERGHPFDPHIEVGAMIEVPSAAMVPDMLAPYVDFFSLGTNDLIQYTLAIDRGNERVAYLYEPTHLAMLRLIKNTIDMGHRHGVWTGICGGMGGDPMLTPLLIGLGVNELSVNPPLIPVVKDAIRSITYSEAKDIADSALFSPSNADIQDLSRRLTEQVAPEILELVD